MLKVFLRRDCSEKTAVPAQYSRKGASPFQVLTLFLILASFPGCATLRELALQKPFDQQEAMAIISRIQDQGTRVSSFYAAGKLLAKNWWYGESESDILIAGTKAPFRLKIEVTHPWGQPILFILIQPARLEVLSFPDRRLYLGRLRSDALAKFLPAGLEPELVWMALRGYPGLKHFKGITSLNTNQVSLLNEKGEEMETIDLYPGGLLPRLASYSSEDVGLAFLDFQESEGMVYAKEVRMEHRRGGSTLTLRAKTTVLNKNIPEEIFTLEKPPGFDTHYLD